MTAYSRCELARMQEAEDWPMHSSGDTEGAEKVTWVSRTSKGAKGSERILKKRKSSRGEESKTRLRQPSRKRKVARAQEIVVVTTNPIQSNPSHLPCGIPGNAISPLSRPPSKGGWPRSPSSLRRISESSKPPLGPLER